MWPERGLSVLIADDEEDIRRLVGIRLELDGRFTVVGEAENGADAVGDAKTLQPDVVLLDLMMPVLDGFSALRLIRLVAPAALVVTFSALPPTLPHVVGLGADGHLCKSDVSGVADTLHGVWASRQQHIAV